MENLNETQKLELSSEALVYLKETAKWQKFFAILGFIAIGFLVVIAIFAGVIFGALGNAGLMPIPPFFFSVIYLLIAGLLILPAIYQYKFATQTLAALQSNNSEMLTEALKNQKSYNKYNGILTIVVLGLYAVILLIGLIAGLFSAFM